MWEWGGGGDIYIVWEWGGGWGGGSTQLFRQPMRLNKVNLNSGVALLLNVSYKYTRARFESKFLFPLNIAICSLLGFVSALMLQCPSHI